MNIQNWEKMSVLEIAKDLTQTSDRKPEAQIAVAQAFIQAKLNKALIDGQNKLVLATWALVIATLILAWIK